MRTFDGTSPTVAQAEPVAVRDRTPGWQGWIRLALVSAFVCTIAVIAGSMAVLWVTNSFSEPSIRIDDPLVNTVIVVAIDGAVATPGLYELPGGSRVQHVLDAAGGIREDGDLASVNPAERILDGQRIVIPSMVPSPAAQPGSEANIAGAEPPEATNVMQQPSALRGEHGGAIDLNSASQAELETLPGIGPVKAAAIIAYRTEHGPFASIAELDDVDGISEAIVTDLTPLVYVGS